MDKTLLIKEILNLNKNEKIILITRPARFGKTVNLDMMRRFFENFIHNKGEQEINRQLFVGGIIDNGKGARITIPPLAISKHESIINQYQGKYPVITMTFKFEQMKTYDDFIDELRAMIGAMCRSHQYLISLPERIPNIICEKESWKLGRLLYHSNDLSSDEIMTSLSFFIEIIHLYHHKPVIVLIDDYDMPWSRAYRLFDNTTRDFEKVHYTMVRLLSMAFRSTSYIERAIIMGTMALRFDDGYNVSGYTILDDKFWPYFGFTENDVDTLLQNENVKYNRHEIKEWYGGYIFGSREMIFNPQSVIQCLNNYGQLRRYWRKLDIDNLHMLANISDSFYAIQLNDLTYKYSSVLWIEKPFTYDVLFEQMDIFQYLLFHGFLTARLIGGKPELGNRYSLTVPNNEIRSVLKNFLESHN